MDSLCLALEQSVWDGEDSPRDKIMARECSRRGCLNSRMVGVQGDRTLCLNIDQTDTTHRDLPGRRDPLGHQGTPEPR